MSDNPLFWLVLVLKRSIGEWIYLRAFCFVPLICISVFVPVPYCLDDCSFAVYSEVKQVDSSSSIFLSQDCLAVVSKAAVNLGVQISLVPALSSFLKKKKKIIYLFGCPRC